MRRLPEAPVGPKIGRERPRATLRSRGRRQPRVFMEPFEPHIASTRLTLVLFGGPVLFRGSRRFTLSPFQGALLGVLGGSDREVSRQRVAQLLWEPAKDALVRRRISQLLYTVKRSTGISDLIVVRGEALALRPERVQTDLETLEQLLRDGDFARSAELLRAGFLSTASHPTTQAFEDWSEGKRLRLRSDLREKAATTWATSSATGRWGLAEEAAEVLFGLNPADEECLRKVVQARAMCGRLESAEAFYRTFEERMSAVRGGSWGPDPETLRLLERIRGSDDATTAPLTVAIAAEKEPAMIGRNEELARLSRILTEVPKVELRIILVSGEAGIGKTRLVRDGLHPARLEGLRIMAGQFAEFERDIPLNSLLEALSEPVLHEALDRLPDPWRTVVLALLPEFHQGPDPLPEVPYVQPGELPRRLFEALRLLLLELVVSAPVVLFLDDLQWADETTIAALEYLRRRWEGGRLTLVLTLRPEGLSPSSRVGRFIADLKGRPGVEHLELTELSQEAAEALVREVADQSLTAKEQRALASLGGQVPFFVIELVQEHDAGRLDPQPIDGDHIPIPLSIQQVLEQRLTNLPPPADLVLKALAVYGHPSGVTELTGLAEIPAETCVAALEQLHAFRLVHWVAGGVLLRHQLIRHTVYAGTGEASRRWLHGKVAEHLQLQNPPPVDQLALHYHRAGMHDQALKFALEAADKAESSGGVPEALGYLGIARRSTEEPVHTTNIIGKLAHLHYLHRNFAEAGPLLTLAVEKFRNQDRIAEALNAETERVDTLSQQESLPAGPLKELKRIKAEAREHGCWEVVAKALDVEIRLLARSGVVDGAAAVLQEAEECIVEGDVTAQCAAHRTLGFHLYYGSPELALSHTRTSVRLAKSHKLRNEDILSINRFLVVLISRGLLNTDEGQWALQQGELAAEKSGDLFAKFNLRSNVGVWHMDVGEYDRARVAFARAGELLKNTEARYAHFCLLSNQGELALVEGDSDQAAELFESASQFLEPGTAPHAFRLIEAGLGTCALKHGNLGEAKRRAERLHPVPEEWFHDPTLIVVFRSELAARLGRQKEGLSILSEAAAQIERRLIPNWLNIKFEQTKLQSKSDAAAAAQIARPALLTAKELGLTIQVARFSRYL